MKAWKRYLFITLPLSILASIINFYVKDDSVYDLYLSFGTSIIGGDMRYAAILE